MGRRDKHHHHKDKHKEKRDKSRTIGEPLKGTIAVTPSGFGFVMTEKEGPDFFIPPRYIGQAMHGDEVEVVEIEDDRKFSGGEDRGPVGKVLRVLRQKKDTIVAEIIAGHMARALSKRIPNDIKLVGGYLGAKRGDWVEIRLLPANPKHGDERKAEVIAKIGQVGVIINDLQAVIREYDLIPPYTETQNAAAGSLEPIDIPREDLTKLPTVTIDPIDAKDFDDAISLSPGEKKNEIVLGVHIADVASWIRPGDKLDKEAYERSFTAYLPGMTLPMLPKTLTAKISLTEGDDSPAHTVLMTIDLKTGKIVKTRRCHSWVNITQRLNFDEVDEFIEGRTPPNWKPEIIPFMKDVLAVYRTMRKYRKMTEEFLELATTEIRIMCDDETKNIIGLREEVQTEADQLVEECMLAANSEVAKELSSRSIPGLYRTHDEPDPEKLDEFVSFVYEGFGIMPGDLSSRSACNKFLKSLDDDRTRPMIINGFLQSMKRAVYQENPALHFGLGKGRYSHFTSPIRRYPDLIVHQQLLAADLKENLKSKKDMTLIAEHCVECESRVDDAYYAANDRLKLYYLRQMLDSGDTDVHEGVVTKITSSGMVVDVPKFGILGFVERERIGRGFHKRRGKMKDLEGHQKYKCGDFVYLRLDRIDFIRGSAIFKPVRY